MTFCGPLMNFVSFLRCGRVVPDVHRACSVAHVHSTRFPYNDVLLSTTPLLEKKSVCFIHFSICLSVNKTHKAFPLICQRILTKNYAPFAFVPQLTGTTFCRPCNGTSHLPRTFQAQGVQWSHDHNTHNYLNNQCSYEFILYSKFLSGRTFILYRICEVRIGLFILASSVILF